MAKLKVDYGAWVLVGDGRKALLLHNEGDAELINLRRLEVREHDNPPTHEQGSDAPGRSGTPSGTRTGSIGETDWHQIEEDRFAAEIADRLNRAAAAREYKSLIVVAPPKTLTEIRRRLSAEAHRRVTAEIAKDLIHHPIPEIERILHDHVMDE